MLIERFFRSGLFDRTASHAPKKIDENTKLLLLGLSSGGNREIEK